MRAFVITAPHQWTVDDIEPPTAAAGQVVVDVERTGICGTDVELFSGEMASASASPESRVRSTPGCWR